MSNWAAEIAAISRSVAARIAPHLEVRLFQVYGNNWEACITDQYSMQESRRRRVASILSDHRFCLRVFGYDRATEDWAPEEHRRMARKLRGIANAAHHDDHLTDDDLRRARHIGNIFSSTFPGAAPWVSRKGMDIDIRYNLPRMAALRRDTFVVVLPTGRNLTIRTPAELANKGELQIRATGKGWPGADGAPPGDVNIFLKIL